MKKFISKVIITTMLVGSLSGLAFAGVKITDVNFFLEKIAKIEDPEKKKLGVDILEMYIGNDSVDIKGLKKAIKIKASDEQIKELEKKGYTLDEALESLDVLENMSKSDRQNFIKAVNDGNIDDMKAIVNSNIDSDNKNDEKPKDDSTSSVSPEEPKKEEKIQAKTYKFKDLENHWAKDDIEFLSDKGIITGQGEGIFNPNGKITRAQFTSLIVRLFGLKQRDPFYGITFKDIQGDDWYYDNIKIASEYKLINGTDEYTFNANKTVTREEMVTIIIRAIESQDIQIKDSNDISIDMFDDKANISKWSADNINKALKMNIINGKSESTVDAKGEATRAESAVIIKRVYDLIKK